MYFYEGVGVQNRFPQNVPLWHVNYFDLKANQDLVGSREMFTSPLKIKIRGLAHSKPQPETMFRDLSRGQGKHLITEYLLLLSTAHALLRGLTIRATFLFLGHTEFILPGDIFHP